MVMSNIFTMTQLDVLVSDKILSYLPRIVQVSVSRGLGRSAVEIVRGYHLSTAEVNDGTAYFMNAPLARDIYCRLPNRRCISKIISKIIRSYPELMLVWGDFGDAEDIVVGLLRKYLYINQDASWFVAIGKDMGGAYILDPICIMINSSSIMHKRLKHIVKKANQTYGVDHSQRLVTALGGLKGFISKYDHVVNRYRY